MMRYALVGTLLICTVFSIAALEGQSFSSEERPIFYLFHSFTCVRCDGARDFVTELSERYPGIEFRILEVVKNRENQALFTKLAHELGIRTPGVPVFVFNNSYLVGFKEGNRAKRLLVSMIEFELEETRSTRSLTDLPLFGGVDPRALSLPLFTVVIGLLDGINPCALWVLMLLLGLLVNTGSRRRMVLIGGIFIFFSVLIYFIFMTAWLNFFSLLRFRETATLVLGIGVIVLGILNIKELFWFRKGPSLVILESSKPRIYDRMRKIISSQKAPLLVLGTASLAFFVNLAEFGCTVGLPAVYTKVLSLQQLTTTTQYIYMVLYNMVYVVPLLGVLVVITFTLGKYRLPQKAAKVLKLTSGVIMLTLGLLLIISPELLIFA